jgi:hypothetical protein
VIVVGGFNTSLDKLVEVDALVIADAALERPPRAVVLHPVAREHMNPGIA